MNEKEFKEKNRKDVCSPCPKRVPCGLKDAICRLVTPCDLCSIKDTCTSLCDQMEAYLTRANKKSMSTTSFNKSPRTEDFFSYIDYKNRKGEKVFLRLNPLIKFDIPWGALSEEHQEIVKAHFIQRKSYQEVAEEFNLAPSTIYEIIRGNENSRGALGKLEEYSRYRVLIEMFRENLTEEEKLVVEEYYFKFKPLKNILINGKTQRTVYRVLNKAKDKLTELGKNMKDKVQYMDTPTDFDLFIDLFETLKREYEVFKLDKVTMVREGNHEFYFRNEDLSYIG